MKIACHSKSSVTIVAPSGRIDAETAPELQERLLALIQRGNGLLVLDFSAVDYMASAGLRVLIQVTRRCEQTEGRLALASLSDFVRDLLTITGFLEHLEIFDTADAAVGVLAE